MTKQLEGRVAIVIGAAQGIGFGIAEVFSEAGARLVIGDNDAEKTAATAARLGAPHLVTEADVSSKADCERLVVKVLDAFGRVDILVQNAGIFPWTTIEETSVEEWDRVLAVNLRGCFLAAQACLGPMRTAGYGRMVFISSITGPRVTSPGHGHYSASKAGINGFIRAAALEFAPYGITVNGVEPGNILTDGMKAHRSPEYIQKMKASVPLGRLGTPRDVAHACLFLASDHASYVTGTTIIVDGGQILPEGGNFDIAPT